ncbi:pentatricopeptide repeat-containing protein [Pyrus ussuriensis x Pyrus communis]|uniref:Pentatricopeptide repeat-containing protein n=1 Tax=Pyrus ussuriensis x Pyrus communis TaxID=2448454 RepID=A0A5N5FQ22_9ROSA|nr:pentatricopeptide repeat-containing protein [Pyrus ussuriensis x Pyrus communis]
MHTFVGCFHWKGGSWVCGETWVSVEFIFDEYDSEFVYIVWWRYVSRNILMSQLVKRDDIKGAYDVFLRMPGRSVRSWTLKISGSVQCGKPKEAIGLFSEMEEAGVRPNEVMVVAVLVACADWGDLGLGRRIHEFSNQSGFSKNVRVSNTVIEMYVKCGCLEDACKVFDGMKERTIVS